MITVKVFVTLKDDKISGQVSVPLTGFPGASGRYFNGSTTLKVYLRDGRLVVIAEDLEVNGKKLDPAIKARLSSMNFAEEFNRDPKNAEMFAKFESIEVKDSKVYIKLRARNESETDSSPVKKPATKDDDSPPTGDDAAKPEQKTPEPATSETPAPKAAA